MGKMLDSASFAQAIRDLYAGRKTEDTYALVNNIAQSVAALAVLAKNDTMATLNIVAMSTAWHKIKRDLDANKPPDTGDLISLTGNMLAVTASLHTKVPTGLNVACILLGVGGIVYSNRDSIKNKINQILEDNPAIQQQLNEVKNYFNALISEKNPELEARKLASNISVKVTEQPKEKAPTQAVAQNQSTQQPQHKTSVEHCINHPSFAKISPAEQQMALAYAQAKDAEASQKQTAQTPQQPSNVAHNDELNERGLNKRLLAEAQAESAARNSQGQSV
jgi:chemotaxis protein histidine kinase CheA